MDSAEPESFVHCCPFIFVVVLLYSETVGLGNRELLIYFLFFLKADPQHLKLYREMLSLMADLSDSLLDMKCVIQRCGLHC